MSDRPQESIEEPRNGLVDTLAEGDTPFIRTPSVEAAFRAVPRHVFVPNAPLETAYSGDVIITKEGADGLPISSSSMPAIMATMLEQLELRPGHRVMEIGAGTGYNAALMAHIVGETGDVVAVDLDQDIVDDARRHLTSVGYGNVKVVCGDGGLGYAEGAPYDRIIVTVGAWDVVPAWWDQLSLGGRLVVPLNTVGQFEHSIAFVNVGDHLESASVANCSFMLMRGQFQGPTRLITIGPDSSLWVRGQQAGEVDPDGLYELLAGPSKDVSTGIEVSGDDWWGLSTWLAVHRQPLFTMFASGDSAERGIVPGFVQEVGGRRMRATQGIVAKGTMCLLTRLPAAPSEETPSSDEPLELFVRTYGRDDALGRGITDLLVAWDRAGRPEAQFAGFKALRKDTEYEPAADESVVEKRWTNLVATIGVP